MPRRIGVNALYLIPGGVGGTEIYLRNLLEALAKLPSSDEFFVFTNSETGSDIVPGSARFHAKPQQLRAANRPARLLWEQTMLPLETRRLRLDCLFNPGFTAPIFRACPNVTVFHDLQHKRHPEYFRPLDLPAWNFFLAAAARRSDILVVDSEASRQDALRYYPLDPERVCVVPLGVEDAFFGLSRRRVALEPMILCASTLHPHKNLERLIEAFAIFRQDRPEYRLVITGVRGFHTAAIEAQIARLECRQSVQLTGWIEREALYELFCRAEAFVYPSTFEGFGLPVLEAMAAGVPLACSNIEPLRSIVGDSAVQFSPNDTAAITDAIRRLTSEPELRSRLAEAGPQRARQFTWEACARGTMAAITRAIGADPQAGS